MCGIIGFATTSHNEDLPSRVTFMNQALYVNALRGQHSTGFFKVDTKRGGATYVKDACDARLFLQQRSLVAHLDDVSKDHWLVVGHNRHATLGGRGLDNAHPFAAGHVCMVHNGTLRSYYSLPQHPEGDSDSARVCQAMGKAGSDVTEVTELLADLQGDYAFVWHDSRVNQLRIATNGRRPLSYLRHGTHMFFASEGMMVKMLLSRVDANAKLPRINHFKPFHLYTLDQDSLDWQTTPYREKERVVTRYFPHTNKPNTVVDADYKDIPVKADKPQEGESKRAAKARVKLSNEALVKCGLPWRVGAVIDVSNDEMDFYETGKNDYTEDPLGYVSGFAEYVKPGEHQIPYLVQATVHQTVLSDVWHETVDTIKATIVSAKIVKGELQLTCIYREVGARRREYTVAFRDGPYWTKDLDRFFDGYRHSYSDDDLPKWKFNDQVRLSCREVDLLLARAKCDICEKDAEDVAYDNIRMSGLQTFACGTCVDAGDNDTDVVPGPLDEKPVLQLPHKSKPRVRVQHDGTVIMPGKL